MPKFTHEEMVDVFEKHDFPEVPSCHPYGFQYKILDNDRVKLIQSKYILDQIPVGRRIIIRDWKYSGEHGYCVGRTILTRLSYNEWNEEYESYTL